MSLETLLSEYIFDFSTLRIIFIDDVTGILKTENQTIEAYYKQCQNKT